MLLYQIIFNIQNPRYTLFGEKKSPHDGWGTMYYSPWAHPWLHIGWKNLVSMSDYETKGPELKSPKCIFGTKQGQKKTSLRKNSTFVAQEDGGIGNQHAAAALKDNKSM